MGIGATPRTYGRNGRKIRRTKRIIDRIGADMKTFEPVGYCVMKKVPYGKVINVWKIQKYFAGLNGADLRNRLQPEAREPKAICWKLRRAKPCAAAANMHLRTPFLFNFPHFTKEWIPGCF